MYYPNKILKVSKIRSLWYPERVTRRTARLAGGVTLSAGQILYETTAAANATQTITFGGTVTGGTFSLLFVAQNGYDVVGPITYSGTAATMRANLQAALDAYFGPSQAVVTGSGPYTITYSGNLVASLNVPTPVAVNALTGTSPTVTPAAGTTGSGGLGFWEAYTAASGNGTVYGILEQDTKTGPDGTIIDEHGSTGQQTVELLTSGAYLLSQITGADTTLFPSTGAYGRMGKFASGGWNTYPAYFTGSVLFVPGF